MKTYRRHSETEGEDTREGNQTLIETNWKTEPGLQAKQSTLCEQPRANQHQSWEECSLVRLHGTTAPKDLVHRVSKSQRKLAFGCPTQPRSLNNAQSPERLRGSSLCRLPMLETQNKRPNECKSQ